MYSISLKQQILNFQLFLYLHNGEYSLKEIKWLCIFQVIYKLRFCNMIWYVNMVSKRYDDNTLPHSVISSFDTALPSLRSRACSNLQMWKIRTGVSKISGFLVKSYLNKSYNNSRISNDINMKRGSVSKLIRKFQWRQKIWVWCLGVDGKFYIVDFPFFFWFVVFWKPNSGRTVHNL